MLSLCLPSPHAALYDRGKFFGCTRSVPSPMTLAFAKSLTARHSRNPHHPFQMGGWFRGFTGSLFRCGRVELLAPLYGSDRAYTQPTGTFTLELSTCWSPFTSSGITTVVTERFHRWDFHPLDYQLASLHRLFHPLPHAGLSRRTNIAISLVNNFWTPWRALIAEKYRVTLLNAPDDSLCNRTQECSLR